MNTRNIFVAIAFMLSFAFGVYAQTQEEIRIYINPGHGAWDADSRPMGTVKHGANNAYTDANNDTANFFESNTNIYKGFGLLQKLIDYGVPFDHTKNQTNENPHRIGAALDLSQNIVMSHVKAGAYPAYIDYTNGTLNPDSKYYDRSLSEIAAEVEENDFDVFISIHSNAASDNEVNYLYFALDGYGNYEAKDALSKEIARCAWNHRILDRHQAWTHYDYTMTVADLAAGKGKIAKQNLSVLRHNVPSYLVEGYFHTYEPSRHRAMNWDVDRIEGADYARGIADYFCWEKEQVGDIYGVVRDMYQTFTHEFYHGRVRTNDIYLPLNNVKVTLKKEGIEVATYMTDDEYNGAFVFRDLAPGDYTLEFYHENYKEAEPLVVTVKAATTAYPAVFLENLYYIPGSDKYVNYPDSLAGKDYKLVDTYNVVGSEITLLSEQLVGKTIRRQIVRDNKLYILVLDEENEPYIYLADLVEGTVTEIDKAAVTMGANGRLKISDIALTADHVLVASGLSKVHHNNDIASGDKEERGIVNVYKWTKNNKTELPETCELWFSTDYACYFNRSLLGKSIAYSGTIEDGTLTMTCHHAISTEDIGLRFAQVTIAEGEYASIIRIDSWKQPPLETYFYGDVLSSNEDFELVVSPLGDNNYVIDGNRVAPFEWTGKDDGSEPEILGRNELIDVQVNGANYFKYCGNSIMVAPNIDENGKMIGLRAFNITEGFDNADEITLNGAIIEPIDYTFASAHGELALEIDDSDRNNPKTIGAEIEFFLVVDGKVFKFTTAEVSQPATPNAYAYNLVNTETEDKANLTFKLTESSANVDIILSPVNPGDKIIYNLGALGAGEHSHEIDLQQLAGNEYTWEVSVSNKPNIGTSIVYIDNTWGASSDEPFNGGIAIDDNPESENFGNVYVSTSSKGIYVYDADGNIANEIGYWTNHGGDLSRGAVSNGKFYIADNSANKAGVWVLDPADPTVENQIVSNAPTCAVSFTGEGAERTMYTVATKINGVCTSTDTSYQLYKYAIEETDNLIGNPTWIEAADAKIFGANHHSVIAVESGQFVSQYRTTSSNYAPGFFFIDNDGNVYNYATDLQSTLPGSEKGGMALSKDGSLFAIIGLNSTIQVYDVEWTNGIPAFTHNTEIHTNPGFVWQLAFDYAKNLHCYNDKAGYCIHAVPCDANIVVTPAKMSYAINSSGASAIDSIGIDEINAPIEYFNLQGIKIENPTNGIFIKKQGANVSKVIK